MQVARLDEFGFLAIQGKDAISFLQGYATCDLNNLSVSHSLLGAICNLQGRMVASFRATSLPDGLLLRLDRGLVEHTIKFLAKYIVFSKAELSDMSETYVCYGLIGNLQRPEAMAIGDSTNLSGSIVIKVSDSGPRYEAWSQDGFSGEAITGSIWQLAEIADGYVWVSAGTTEEFIPQMFNYHHIDGIDFDKGCYLGQEIIARLEYRGKLKRKLHRGRSTTPLASGDDLVDSTGKIIGPVVSVAESAEGYMVLAVLKNSTDNDIKASAKEGELFTLSPVQVEVPQ